MKLHKQTRESWHYYLNQHEMIVLVDLLRKFPFTEDAPARISKTALDPKTAERENLLQEFLTEHRKELQKQARQLLQDEKFKQAGEGILLKLKAADRELLLQILNDIRVGAWRELGQPEELEAAEAKYQGRERALNRLMNLAGYFEHHLIRPE